MVTVSTEVNGKCRSAHAESPTAIHPYISAKRYADMNKSVRTLGQFEHHTEIISLGQSFGFTWSNDLKYSTNPKTIVQHICMFAGNRMFMGQMTTGV